MHRRIARSFFILICGALATAVGVVGGLLFTRPGHHLLIRLVSDQSHRFLRGSLHISEMSGSLLRGFTLQEVVIRDTAGELVVSAPLVEVRYQLPNLLAGRIVLSEARLVRPEFRIVRHRSRPDRPGRTNLEEILRLGEGPGGGVSPLIEIRNLTLEEGRAVIRLPWNPDGRLRTARQVDSALAYERTRPGRRIEEGPEGLELVRTLEHVTGFLPVLRLSTPDRQPVTLRFDPLAVRVSDPPLPIRELRGRLRTRGDSLLFEVDRAELPGTSLRGTGRIDWPRDTLLYRFSLEAPRLALADLRWISPEFPPFTGSARVRAVSLSGTRTEYSIRDLVAGDASNRVRGRLVAINDSYRGLGFRDLNVDLERLNLDHVRAYLDTLPFHGWVSGPLTAEGFFDGMTVGLDWDFEDTLVPEGAGSQFSLAGSVSLGGSEGLVFNGTRLRSSDVDLRTVRAQAPSVTLNGRLRAAGTLVGPLRNVVFEGDAAHQDGDRPVSRASGKVRFDNRGAVLGIETDLVLDSLVFAGLQGSYPSLSAKGSLGGSVKLAGTLEALSVDAEVGGALGQVRVQGGVTLYPPRWGADSLRLGFGRLDLSALVVGAPPTRLSGALAATGRLDSAVAPAGRIAVALGPSSLAGFALDTTRISLHAADSVITLDTLLSHWRDGRLSGGGTLGWDAPKSGRMVFHLEATELTPFDSLATAVTGLARDTAPESGEVPLRGRGRGDLVLSGAFPSLQAQLSVALDSARWLGLRGKTLNGQLAWQRETGRQPESVLARVFADSFWVGRLLFTGIRGEARGRPDSLRWAASLAARDGEVARAAGGGAYQRLAGGEVRLTADSLNLDLLGRRWMLERRLDARLSEREIGLDTVRLVTRDGSGSVQLAGTIPRQGPGDLSVRMLGVELRDLYGMVQRDTAGIAGLVAADARVSGTAREPEFRGTATLTGGGFGDFQAPLIRGAFDYRSRQLRGNLTFWRAGKPVLEADAMLPLDLALAGASSRQLSGPISIVARGDSIDLAILEAFTPNLRQVNGQMDVDTRIEGTWDTPRLAGWIRLRDGAATVPGLGVRYRDIGGTVRLAGDSVLSDGLRLAGPVGELAIGGGLRLERLTRPVLDLGLTTRDFQVMDVPNFMAIRSTGEVRMSGTLEHPILRGQGRIANSVVYFADLVQKEIVNLEDPLFADLVDTLAMRRYSLGAAFQSRFLDSLTIRGLQLEIGEAVWLRSNEANFQLEGSVVVNKNPYRNPEIPMYVVVGDLNVPRGTYTLKAGGVINRTFTVDRGTVRYFGNPDAELDVEAQHIVRSPQGGAENIPVIAHITGTLTVPKLTLTTPPDRPPLTEPQLIALLTVGSTDPLAVGAVGQQAFAVAASALASELSRALISDLRAPVDIIEIRPGIATGQQVGQGGVATQVAIGRALTEKLFVTANAGFCLGSGQASFTARNLGATLEYRFRPTLRGQLSAEPIQTCLARGVDIFGTARRYQFGAELRWDRDY